MLNTEAFSGTPECIKPVYHCEGVNKPIHLLSGRVEFTLDKQTVTGEGEVYLDWLPRPDVRLWLYPEGASFCQLGLRPFTDDKFLVEFPDSNIAIDVQWANSYWSPRPESEFEVPAIAVVPFTVGAARKLDYAILHLVNFHQYWGAPIRDETDSRRVRSWAGRLELHSSEWHITVDQCPDVQEIYDQLQAGGYAITHTVKVERVDGKPFSPRKLENLLRPLGMFLSFTRGSWCVPVLVAGFTQKQGRVWEMWETPDMFRIPSRPAVASWFPEHSPEAVAPLFARFCEMWESGKWHEILRMALAYYFFANAPNADREPQLITAQACLEMLAQVVLVDKERFISEEGFKNLSAADKIRLLQSWARIPKDIPNELEMLVKAAEQEKDWYDSAGVVTGLRNLLVHPNRQKINKYFDDRMPRGVAWGTTQIALWNIELVLLSLLGYEGDYHNRIKGLYLYKGAVEPVPWATEV